MVCEARSLKLGRGPIRDTGEALEDLACGGADREKHQHFQVVDCCGYNKSGVCDKRIGNGVHIGYHCNSLKDQQGVPHHKSCGGDLEDH